MHVLRFYLVVLLLRSDIIGDDTERKVWHSMYCLPVCIACYVHVA